MNLGSKIRKVVVAAGFSAGLVAMAVPAQAGSLDRGFLAGLLGGVALGALAAHAHQQSAPVLAAVPADLDTPMVLPEARPQVRSLRRGPGQLKARAGRVTQPRSSRAQRASPTAIAKCGDYLSNQARRLGSETVRVSSAGPQVRSPDGVVALPIRARIEYAHKGAKQVRQARVTCVVNSDGRVSEIR